MLASVDASTCGIDSSIHDLFYQACYYHRTLLVCRGLEDSARGASVSNCDLMEDPVVDQDVRVVVGSTCFNEVRAEYHLSQDLSPLCYTCTHTPPVNVLQSYPHHTYRDAASSVAACQSALCLKHETTTTC